MGVIAWVSGGRGGGEGGCWNSMLLHGYQVGGEGGWLLELHVIAWVAGGRGGGVAVGIPWAFPGMVLKCHQEK